MVLFSLNNLLFKSFTLTACEIVGDNCVDDRTVVVVAVEDWLTGLGQHLDA